MKKIFLFLSILLLTNCSTRSVKFGKRCTDVADNNSYEKSFVWIVDKATLSAFDQKINKENCLNNGEAT